MTYLIKECIIVYSTLNKRKKRMDESSNSKLQPMFTLFLQKIEQISKIRTILLIKKCNNSWIECNNYQLEIN